jgi:hypothetical protein
LIKELPAVELNVAETDVSAFMVTLHVEVPAHAPDQPANAALDAGDALSVTTVPAANVALHVVPQLMPDGLLEMVPAPVPELCAVS